MIEVWRLDEGLNFVDGEGIEKEIDESLFCFLNTRFVKLFLRANSITLANFSEGIKGNDAEYWNYSQ